VTLFKSAELMMTAVPVGRDVATKRPIIYVSAGPVVAGDLLDIRAHIQATNENEFSVAWNMYVTINTDMVNHLLGQIDYSTGRNLLRPIHHDGLVNSFLYQCPVTSPNLYVTLCVTTKPLIGSSKLPKGRDLDINYGMLTVRRN
jgi:hypothetical protein